MATDPRPVLGLIFPPADRAIPEEGVAMYGEQLRFVVAGLGIERMTPAGFDVALSRIPEAARRLADAGATAIELTGTSLTFHRGEGFNRELRDAVAAASRLRATTMSDGVIAALELAGARRIAVATAYNDEINARLRAFLLEHGIEAVVITGMGLEVMPDIARVTQEQLLEFSAGVHASAPHADALLVSCGGFRTLELIAPLESRTGVPVVSSMPHGLWAGARLAGLSGMVRGYGEVLSRVLPAG
jgi:arylmalonate decarboxylase